MAACVALGKLGRVRGRCRPVHLAGDTLSNPNLLAVPLELVALPADGGFAFACNCRSCAGGYVVEATSRGREDLGYPCDELKQIVYCPQCRKRRMVHIRVVDVTTEARPEARYTKSARRHRDRHQEPS